MTASKAHSSAREDACQESKCLLNYERQDKSSKVLVLLEGKNVKIEIY